MTLYERKILQICTANFAICETNSQVSPVLSGIDCTTVLDLSTFWSTSWSILSVNICIYLYIETLNFIYFQFILNLPFTLSNSDQLFQSFPAYRNFSFASAELIFCLVKLFSHFSTLLFWLSSGKLFSTFTFLSFLISSVQNFSLIFLLCLG